MKKEKKCAATKRAKLSSWLLTQSGYMWMEVIQYALNSPPAIFAL